MARVNDRTFFLSLSCVYIRTGKSRGCNSSHTASPLRVVG